MPSGNSARRTARPPMRLTQKDLSMYKDDISGLESPAQLPKTRRGRRQHARVRAREERVLMKAAVIDRFGPPSTLKLRVLPRPEPGPNEVLIALHAAGVGVWDADIRGG